jgi:hypothetical protein
MKIEVPISKWSEQYIKDTFAMYTETDKLEPMEKNCIIHIYPYEDTVRDEKAEELVGFIDVMNCDLAIYDLTRKTVYKTHRHDAVNIRPDVDLSVQIRVFKDLSTMIILHSYKKKIDFWNFQAFEVFCE